MKPNYKKNSITKNVQYRKHWKQNINNKYKTLLLDGFIS